MQAVGIGCFWFALKGGVPENSEAFSPDDHVKHIKTALENVDNVSNVQISGKPNFLHFPSFATDEYEEENFFPLFSFLRIEFDIFFPKRLQHKYSNARDKGYEAEHFNVKIIGTIDLPVAIISSEVHAPPQRLPRLSPSHAVKFVREYLAEKLAGDPQIDFQTLGPSPFHADIFLQAANDVAEAEFEDLSEPDGYSTLYFRLPVKEADLVDEFLKYNEKILGSFYNVVGMRNVSLFTTLRVVDNAKVLLAGSEETSMLKRFLRRRTEAGAVDKIYDAILTEKMNRIDLDRYLANLRRTSVLNGGNVFDRFLNRIVEEIDTAPTDDIKQLVQIVEDRRRGYFANLSTLFSGVLGGLLGAVIGALLTLSFGSSSIAPTGKTPTQQSKVISGQ